MMVAVVDEMMLARLGSWTGWAGDRASWPVTDIGASVVEWAIKVHHSHYGDTFLVQALEQSRPHPFVGPESWPLAAPRSLAGLLGRACALSMLPPSARGKLTPKPGRDANAAARSDLFVLEIAGLACRAGWTVEIEPTLSDGRRPDLHLTSSSNDWWIEVTSMTPDRQRRNSEAWFHRLLDHVRAIELTCDVSVHGHVDSIELADDDFDHFIARLDAAASSAATTGQSQTLRAPGVELEVQPGRAEGRIVDGPPLSGDMWPRLAERLMTKADQTAAAGPTWIYIVERSDLFELTDLAGVPEQEQLRRLHHNIHTQLASYLHLRGVVLTTGITAATTAASWDTPLSLGTPSGASRPCVMHRHLPGRRSRRTFVIPLTNPGDVDGPHNWLDTENAWLDWALTALGHPTFDAIVATRYADGPQ